MQTNLRAASLLGIERASLIGKAFLRFVAPESYDSLRLIQQAALSDKVENRELVLRKADGKEFPVSMEIVSREESGVRLWRCAFSDITERRRLEEEREKEAHRKDQFLSLQVTN